VVKPFDERELISNIEMAVYKHRMEKKLRESENKFRSVIENASDGIALIDKQGLIIEWNPVMEQIAGLRRPAVIGRPIWDVIFQIMPREKRIAEFQRLYAEQWQVEVHRQYAHKDTLVDFLIEDHKGNRKIVQSNPFTVETSQGIIGGVIMRDVTVQKQAETALRESEERFHQLFETAMDGIVLTRPDGTIHSANPAALSLLGLSAEEIKNVNRIDILDFSDPRVIAGLEERDRLGIFKGEFIGVRKDGSRFPMEISSVLLQQEEILASNFIRDITERKNAEYERNRLITELRNKNDELERFTYTVSHDLKAPLITIRGFLGFLEKDVQAGNIERIRKDVERINDATDKMQRLLSELLELSRIGRIMKPPQIVSFETIVRDAIKLVTGRITEIKVEVEIAPDLPSVCVDRVRFTQVMQNLIDNAVKFMGEQPEPQIWIGQRIDGAKAIFFVRDNGGGIAHENQERVFGLFDKLDSKAEGTGIGLALVKRIIEAHGGEIWVESEGLGKGATFCFTIPSSSQIQ
jgi:two-component system, LuxR family, sensor kinase FixL